MNEKSKYTMMLVYCCFGLWFCWLLVSFVPLPVESQFQPTARLACYIFLTICMEVVGIIAAFYFSCPQIPWRIGIMMAQSLPLHLIAWGAQPNLVWLPIFLSFLGPMIPISYTLYFKRWQAFGAN